MKKIKTFFFCIYVVAAFFSCREDSMSLPDPPIVIEDSTIVVVDTPAVVVPTCSTGFLLLVNSSLAEINFSLNGVSGFKVNIGDSLNIKVDHGTHTVSGFSSKSQNRCTDFVHYENRELTVDSCDFVYEVGYSAGDISSDPRDILAGIYSCLCRKTNPRLQTDTTFQSVWEVKKWNRGIFEMSVFDDPVGLPYSCRDSFIQFGESLSSWQLNLRYDLRTDSLEIDTWSRSDDFMNCGCYEQ